MKSDNVKGKTLPTHRKAYRDDIVPSLAILAGVSLFWWVLLPSLGSWLWEHWHY